MKICFATDFLPEYHKVWGGAEIACYRLYSLLQKRNYQVVFIGSKPDGKPLDRGLQYHAIPVYRDMIGHRCDFILKNAYPLDSLAKRWVQRLFEKEPPDILHLHHFTHLSLSIVEVASKLGIPTVFSLYDLWMLCPNGNLTTRKGKLCSRYHGAHCASCVSFPKKPLVFFRKALFDKYLPSICHFICLTETARDQLAEYGISKERTSVLPLPLFEAYSIGDNDFRDSSILFGGWVLRYKGLHILIEALPMIVKAIPEICLKVLETGVGRRYKASLSNRLKTLGLRDRVIFLGKRSTQEVQSFLRKCSIVAVPEQWSIAWPTFLAEAMLFGKPIVASRIGDIPSFIHHGRTGLLANHKSPEEFAENVIALFMDQQQALEYGAAARDTILQISNPDKISNMLLSVYKRILGSNL